jgi:hypothetical protein
MTAKKKSNWIVKMKCVVYKDVFLSDCTEEEANFNPWYYCTSALETTQVDWEILSVKKNK